MNGHAPYLIRIDIGILIVERFGQSIRVTQWIYPQFREMVGGYRRVEIVIMHQRAVALFCHVHSVANAGRFSLDGGTMTAYRSEWSTAVNNPHEFRTVEIEPRGPLSNVVPSIEDLAGIDLRGHHLADLPQIPDQLELEDEP